MTQQEPPPLTTAEALMLAGLLAIILLSVYRTFFA